MKKIISYVFSLLMILQLLVLTSCKKEDEIEKSKPEPNEEDVCKLVKATMDETYNKGQSRLFATISYEYNVDHQLVKTTAPGLGYQTFEYDSKGQIIKFFRSYNGIPDQTQYIDYDNQGRWIKTINIEKSDSTIYQVSYDTEGNRTKIDILYPDGGTTYTHYKYVNGNMIEKIEYGASTISTTYEYYLDKENKQRSWQIKTFPMGGMATPNKNLLKKESSSTAKNSFTYSYELNEKGYVTKETKLNPDYIFVFTYEYDCL